MSNDEIKEDCFAYNKKKIKCEALKELYCFYEGKCKFYKTKEQILREQYLNNKQDIGE